MTWTSERSGIGVERRLPERDDAPRGGGDDEQNHEQRIAGARADDPRDPARAPGSVVRHGDRRGGPQSRTSDARTADPSGCIGHCRRWPRASRRGRASAADVRPRARAEVARRSRGPSTLSQYFDAVRIRASAAMRKTPEVGHPVAGLEPRQHLVHPVRRGADGHLLRGESGPARGPRRRGAAGPCTRRRPTAPERRGPRSAPSVTLANIPGLRSRSLFASSRRTCAGARLRIEVRVHVRDLRVVRPPRKVIEGHRRALARWTCARSAS